MDHEPQADDRWTYFVSGFSPERGLVCLMAGNPNTAAYVADLLRKEGLTRVKWKNTVDVVAKDGERAADEAI